MSLTIQLPAILETKIRKEADTKGVSIDDYFVQLLQQSNLIVSLDSDDYKEKRGKTLLKKINNTVLPEHVLSRYIYLHEKMESESLPESDYQELLNIVEQEEKLRNKRFKYLIELSEIRKISLTALMGQLGITPQSHYA